MKFDSHSLHKVLCSYSTISTGSTHIHISCRILYLNNIPAVNAVQDLPVLMQDFDSILNVCEHGLQHAWLSILMSLNVDYDLSTLHRINQEICSMGSIYY